MNLIALFRAGHWFIGVHNTAQTAPHVPDTPPDAITRKH